MDETTFNSYVVKKRSWANNKDEPLLHHRNNLRHNWTVYGAIGNCLKKPAVYSLGLSTNQHEY